ncbi:MAG: efflux RND transporter periplasmic adaptor subunit [Verrucomicrobia bacterium]|nr:efflux RND transporter periplasmic adaptor subunit [Verrucomicrobiota bacterium]
MAKSKSYGGLIFLALVVAGGGGGAWYYFNAKTEKAPEFQTTKVSRADIVQSITATGDLQPVVTVDVSSQISGLVLEVKVDFNSQVKAGDVLARIDPATYQQKLLQAEADLASAKASNALTRINAERTRDLFGKKLVSQSEVDTAEAQLAQSDSTMLTRTAAVENAKLDLARCVITAPMDGMVLDRKTDKGRTVAASLNAPVLFTLVNDLTKMQINAAVAEADIGSISEGQEVKFTVDAFPNRTFAGSVRQVRNAASTNQSVVSYATIIDVNNQDLKLKPGMTANVSIVVAQKNGVLAVQNSALRVRLPQALVPKAPVGAAAPGGKAADGLKRRRPLQSKRRSIPTWGPPACRCPAARANAAVVAGAEAAVVVAAEAPAASTTRSSNAPSTNSSAMATPRRSNPSKPASAFPTASRRRSLTASSRATF